MAARYGLVIDLSRCTGCQTCVVACKAENGLERASGMRVETIGGPQRDTPAGVHPNLEMHYLPVPCMHCGQAPCLPSCPTEAIYRRPDGIVLIDEEKCNGCQMCLESCPYGVMIYDPEKDKVWKCSLCAHRIDQGLEPFCVVCCEMEAIFGGDVNDAEATVCEMMRAKKAHPLKAELGTDPAVRYCPPRAHAR